MADFTYGVARPNWLTATGYESVTSNMEFITISSQIDFRTYAQAIAAGQTTTQAMASQINLNKLIEIVSERGQPVVMGQVTTSNGGATYNIFFATEHAGGWQNVPTASGNTLLQRIINDGINYGFGNDLSNVTATTSANVNNMQVIPVGSTAKVYPGFVFTGAGVVNGVVQEVVSPTAFMATVPQTITSGTALTFTPAVGVGVNDTPGTGTNGGLTLAFSNVLT